MARRPLAVPTMAGRRQLMAQADPVVPRTTTVPGDPAVLPGTTAPADPAVLPGTTTAQADPAVLPGTTARADPVAPANGMGIPNVATSTGSRGVTDPHPGDGVRRRGRPGADRSRGPEGHR
jgi:hypothetical protein